MANILKVFVRKNLVKSILTICLIFSSGLLHSSGLHEKKVYGLTSNEMKEAERLFYGLIKTGEKTENCASCHNVGYIDTLNWNPSALDIAKSSYDKDSATFANILLNPSSSKRLQEAHAGFDLESEHIVLLKAYLLKLKDAGEKTKKPTINTFLKFSFFLVLLILFIVDLTVTRKIKYKAVHLLVILVSAYFVFDVIVREAISLGRSKNYQPTQPIKFSHAVHAGQNGTDCQYCHHTAEQSKSAGIPSVNVCMNCHIIVREGTRSGKFEINKIHEAWDNGHPIEWVRIHKLPDHVYFNHSQHVGAGKLDCMECHGPVDEMDVLRQENDLSMGWCLDCHRTKAVQFTENEYYDGMFDEYHEKIKNGEMDSVTVAQIGGTDCQKCHY